MLVDEMPAGREMDALVAEKVLGWHHHPEWEDYFDFCHGWFDSLELARGWFDDPEQSVWSLLYLWKFSECIKKVWLIVEKLMERSLDFYIYTSRGGWVCELNIYYVDDDEALIITEGHTPMLSICRAALKTVGINEIPSD